MPAFLVELPESQRFMSLVGAQDKLIVFAADEAGAREAAEGHAQGDSNALWSSLANVTEIVVGVDLADSGDGWEAFIRLAGAAAQSADLLAQVRQSDIENQISASAGAINGAGVGVVATGILTFGANAADLKIVTIDSKVYTFDDTTLDDVDGHVLIGATAEASLDNLIAAITLGAGAGSTYAASMTIHPTVTAVAGAGDTMDASAKVTGTGNNTIVSTTDVASATWSNATLLGGLNAYVVDDILAAAGGTFTRAATFRVTTINAAGDMSGLEMVDPGEYSVAPSLVANAVTGGAGEEGGTVDITLATAGDHFSILARLVTVINAHPDISDAAVDFSTNGAGIRAFIVSSVADDLGDGALVFEMRRNGSKFSPLVGAITDGGSADAIIKALIPATLAPPRVTGVKS